MLRARRARPVGRRGDARAGRRATRRSRAAAPRRLGWSHGYLRRNARGCVGSGVCAFGCPTSAKQHTGITYVPRAQAAGARDPHRRRRAPRAGARGGRARGVQAGWTAACACEVHAPRGDRRGGHDPHAAAARAQRARRRARASSGATSRCTPRRRRSRAWTRSSTWRGACRRASTSTSSPREGIMFEGVAGPPSYVAMSLPLTRRAPRRGDGRLPPPGAVRPDGQRQLARVACARSAGRPVIRYDLDRGRPRALPHRARADARAVRGGRRARGLPAAARTASTPERARARDLQADGVPPARHRARRRAPDARRRRRRPAAARRRRACTSPTARSCRARSASTRS